MPYQSRGFWCCDFCKLTLDSFEEAKQHELEECQKNPNKPQQQQQGQQPQEQQLPPHYIYQQPRGPVHISGYYPPVPLPMAPVNPAVKREEGSYESGLRSFPLMELNEPNQLHAGDSLACQSIEVFELGPTEVSAAELRRQCSSLSSGQIGMRCIHCSRSGASSPSQATSVPLDVESMAESVRILSERHLAQCRAAPASVREKSQDFYEKRRRDEQERGSSWQEDERSRMTLRNHCYRFCQRLGIVDKMPSGTGLVYAQSQGMYGPGMGMPGRHRFMGAEPFAQASQLRGQERLPMMGESRGMAGHEGFYGPGTEGYTGTFDNAAAMHQSASQQGHDVPQGMMTSQQAGGSPHRGYQQQMGAFDPSGSFPFFQEPNGHWICRYCSHIPPPFRDPQSSWASPNQMPPAPQYVEQHLSMCRAYHNSHQMFQGGPQPTFSYMSQQYPGAFGASHHAAWEGSGQGMPGSQGNSGPYSQQPGAAPNQDNVAHTFPSTPHSMAGRERMPQARTPLPLSSGQRSDRADASIRHAIDYLAATDEATRTPGSIGYEPAGHLVLEEDKLLLTDYFFYLMKQLRLCRFSESDRKTRGGKREKIFIGFGGLQCVHCSEANNCRKFFWSNVDRLANSFAEIPGHVLKCRHCPQPTKDALYQLKQLHPEQMARLPRGSQKVFFRRMWRRLHDDDPQTASPEQKSPPQSTSKDTEVDTVESKPLAESKASGNDSSPSGGTIGSDDSIFIMQRSATEAAKTLADSTSMAFPPSPTSRVLLAIPEDKEWLSDIDCYIRRQIEVFCASRDDVNIAQEDRKFPIHEGQVGIRCIHCALTKEGSGARGTAVAYPFSVSGIYESVREFQRLHLDSCENLPQDMKARLKEFKGSTSLSSVLRKYYVLAAKALGLRDTRDGIRAGAESLPLGPQTAFAFSDSTTTGRDDQRRPTDPTYVEPLGAVGPTLTPVVESKKRKQRDSHEYSGSDKKRSI